MNWVQVFLAIAAPTAGVAGVLLGAWAANRREDRRWRLNTKHALYVEVAQASEELRACMQELRRLRDLNVVPKRGKDRYVRALEVFTVLLPQAAVVANNDVYHAMRGYMVVAETGGGDSVHEVNNLHWALLDSMREDLGFGPPQVHAAWPVGDAFRQDLAAIILNRRLDEAKSDGGDEVSQ